MNSHNLLERCKHLVALAQTGLVYADDYSRDRYQEIQAITYSIINDLTGEPLETISGFYTSEKEYPTPKTDVRAVVFDEQNRILLAHEKDDNGWSLPGGWADIGYSPREVVVKEVAEETGLVVEPVKLLAVMDKKCHPHPPEATYVYKHFIHCRVIGGSLSGAHDIHAAAFFDLANLPALSEKRVLASQIRLLAEHLDQPDKPTYFD